MTMWNFMIFMLLATNILQVEHAQAYFQSKLQAGGGEKNCFCELEGSINDCSCNVDTVDHFNNAKIYPRLKSLLVKDFFRFYKVNLNNKCPFWADDKKCGVKFCHVEWCSDEDIPYGLKTKERNSANPKVQYLKNAIDDNDCVDEFNQKLSYLNTSLSAKAYEEFQKWADHDAAEDDFCILDDLQNGAEYLDLLLNPERYTGYRGPSAHRIWRSIYLENCFGNYNASAPLSTYIPNYDALNSCMEQRTFYRLISGLHTSINIHLCSKYLLSESKDFFAPSTGIWGHNIEEFQRRFSPETTDLRGPSWLKNLYFIYLVELRALAKAAPYLRKEHYYTGSEEDDKEVKRAVHDLLNVTEMFPSHFNENLLFNDGVASMKLKSVFKEKFRNISRIMDCVGCDKCRLWGKLQTQGLGTALKILYSEKFNWKNNKKEYNHSPSKRAYRLTRTEIVALFNSLGRLSNSIYELEFFRKILR